MATASYFDLAACLYYGNFLLLIGLVGFVAWKSYRYSSARVSLRRAFFCLSLCLLIWQVTLFAEVRSTGNALQNGLGRANFAAVVLTVYFTLRFVQEVAARGGAPASLTQRRRWQQAETVIFRIILVQTVRPS